MARCAICHTIIQASERTTSCPECRQDYHGACWDEIGGCGTYGCKRAAVAQKPPIPVLVGAGWGDTKSCPSCNAQINSSLLVCSCGARFPWADPMKREEYLLWTGEQQAIGSARKLLTVLFLFTLIGFTAPVAGPIAGIYAWVKRKQLAGTGGTYLAMGYGSAALGTIYGILIALVAAGF